MRRQEVISLRNRLVGGVGANLFAQFVTVAIQLAQVPVFIHYLGVSRYGEWLLISTIPAYFALSDVGIVAVAGNQMTMLAAEGRLSEAAATFRAALMSTLGVVLMVQAVVTAVVFYVPTAEIWSADTGSALAVLVFCSLLSVLSGLVEGVFRASGQYAKGVFLVNSVRAAEFGGAVCGLILSSRFLYIAIGMAVVRTLCLLALVLFCKRSFPSYRWRFSSADLNKARELVRPGVYFLAFPAGNAISLQGTSMLVGFYSGPVALAIFSTCRTYSRVLVQMVTVFSKTLWPEFSAMYARMEFSRLNAMVKRATFALVIMSSLAALGLFSVSEWILSKWTHGQVAFDEYMMGGLLLISVLTAAWQVPVVLTMAVNRHKETGAFFLLFSVLSVIVTASIYEFSGAFAPLAGMAFFEVALLAFSRRFVNKVLVGHE